MCGRFGLGGFGIFSSRYDLDNKDFKFPERFNIAPTTNVPIVKRNSPNTAVLARWGLVPSWSKEFKSKFATFNARAEGLEKSPVYRKPLHTHRCLIPASFFYEWKTDAEGMKLPYLIHLKNTKVFSFAGLYDVWTDAEGKEFFSCSIITTTPNGVMKKIHTRMPVILPEEKEDAWLSKTQEIPALMRLLVPYKHEDNMEVYRVSTKVNSPRNDSEELTEKV